MSDLSKYVSLKDASTTNHKDLHKKNTEELLASDTFLSNAKELALELDKIVYFYGEGSGITINSFYRSNALNARVGGTNTSQHSFAESCDFTIKNKTVQQVFEDLRTRKIPLDYTKISQVIHEGTWIHIGLVTERFLASKKQPRTMFPLFMRMTKVNGKPTYTTVASVNANNK
jgi:hypothetical protein